MYYEFVSNKCLITVSLITIYPFSWAIGAKGDVRDVFHSLTSEIATQIPLDLLLKEFLGQGIILAPTSG